MTRHAAPEPEGAVTDQVETCDSRRSGAILARVGVETEQKASHHAIGHLGPSRQDWRTPRSLWESLDAEFGFTLDAAADEDNALCWKYYDAEQDALTQDWWADSERGAIFINPPYRRLYPWVQKAYAESLKGATVVLLLPSSTGSKWFKDIVEPHAEVRFLRGRLTFEGAKYPATFDSMLAIFYPPKVQQ